MVDLIDKPDAGTDVRQLLVHRIQKIVGQMRPESVRAAMADTDVGLFLSLAKAEIWQEVELGPIAKARIRGLEHRNELLSRAGGTLTVSDVATMLGISSAAVRKRVANHQLIGIPTDGGYQIPAIQLDENGVVPGLPEVLQSYQLDSPLMCLNWLTSPQSQLDDRRPIDVLMTGSEVALVASAARNVGEQSPA